MALQIESHFSMRKGLLGATKEKLPNGADTFMIYTRALQNTKREDDYNED